MNGKLFTKIMTIAFKRFLYNGTGFWDFKRTSKILLRINLIVLKLCYYQDMSTPESLFDHKNSWRSRLRQNRFKHLRQCS